MNEDKRQDEDAKSLDITAKKLQRFGLDNNSVAKMCEYVKCINKWGKTHNIISGKLTQDDLLYSVFDSLAGASFLSLTNQVYDAGSGGGFPGIPLAIAYPQIKVHLVESNRKKCSFLRLVKTTLALANVSIENCRLEQVKNVNFIVTKAAFSPDNIGILPKALGKGGELALWATKKNRESFLAALEAQDMVLRGQFDYELPNTQQRCILLFSKK